MINAVLGCVSRDVSVGVIRGDNFAGIIIARLSKEAERMAVSHSTSGPKIVSSDADKQDSFVLPSDKRNASDKAECNDDCPCGDQPPPQSKASASTVTAKDVAKAEKTLEYLAMDGRDLAKDGKYIGVLFASDPGAVMTALSNLLKASGGDEKKINALLSAVRLFFRTAVKNSDERAKLHVDAFEASEDVRDCMESICRDNPSLAPSFQSFGDKLKGMKGVSALFIDATFKPMFTKILQKEEKRRAIELRRAEEIELQRLEAERQAAEMERQRLEAQRREQEANERRRVEAKKRKELKEQRIADEAAPTEERRAKWTNAAQKKLQMVEEELTMLETEEEKSVVAIKKLSDILDVMEEVASSGIFDRELLVGTKVQPLFRKVAKRHLDRNSDIGVRALAVYEKMIGNEKQKSALAVVSKPKAAKRSSTKSAAPLIEKSSGAMNSPTKKRPRSRKLQISQPSLPQKEEKSTKKRSKMVQSNSSSTGIAAADPTSKTRPTSTGNKGKKRSASESSDENSSKKKRKTNDEKEKHAYGKAMDEETKHLHSDDGQLSKSAGFTIAPPFHPFDENREEPDLTIDPEWRNHVSEESPEKARNMDTIMDYVLNHPDYVNDVERGRSIHVRGRLYLLLEPLSEETLCSWANLIKKMFCSMDLEKKYELAKSHCEAYYDTATEEFYNSSGNVISNGSRLIHHPMVYCIVITGGKFMGASRFNDYATRNASKIPRSCDEDGKAPTRIVLCFMARLTHLGSSSEAKNYPLKNLRNRIVEEVEAVWLKILMETILGHGMYGDVRSMSAKELSKRWWELYEKYGFAIFGWSADTWSKKLGSESGKARKSGKVRKKGAQKGKPKQTSGDGSSRGFFDRANPSRFATFCFTRSDGTKAEGSKLLWLVDRKPAKEKGHVYYKLVGDGNKTVDRMKPIFYITPNGDKVDISNEIEERYPTPTPWVCIEGVEKKFSQNDVKDELERGLQDGTESNDDIGIVDIQRWNDGRIFVKFDKVWDARGCKFVLGGTKKLFGGGEIGVSCVLENNLPDTLKISEARKRDAASADKKAKKAAASKSAMEIEEFD